MLAFLPLRTSAIAASKSMMRSWTWLSPGRFLASPRTSQPQLTQVSVDPLEIAHDVEKELADIDALRPACAWPSEVF